MSENEFLEVEPTSVGCWGGGGWWECTGGTSSEGEGEEEEEEEEEVESEESNGGGQESGRATNKKRKRAGNVETPWVQNSVFKGKEAETNARGFIVGEALKQDKTWTTGYPQGTRTRIRKSDGARIDEFKCKLSNSHKCPYRIRSVTLADRDQTDVEQKGEHDHKEDHSMKLSRQAKALIKPMICHRMLPSAIRSNLVDAGLETLPTLEQIQGYRTRNYAELVGAQQVTTVEHLVKVARSITCSDWFLMQGLTGRQISKIR